MFYGNQSSSKHHCDWQIKIILVAILARLQTVLSHCLIFCVHVLVFAVLDASTQTGIARDIKHEIVNVHIASTHTKPIQSLHSCNKLSGHRRNTQAFCTDFYTSSTGKHTHAHTLAPSFPAAPGRPCSPGGPGGPGWPLSPIGPVSPVGPWNQKHNFLI